MVVVGASASIGRALARAAIGQGAEVVVAARRSERLDELVEEAGGGTAVVVDVREDKSCESFMEVAGAVLGQIDVLCYTVGFAPLRMMAHTSAEDWGAVFSTNVAGANYVIRAALAHLAPHAVVMVLSSETVGRPRTALGAYGSSKAALEESLNAWRIEHPEFRFCCAAIGATMPTEFGDNFDRELLMWALEDWTSRGLSQEQFMHTDDLAEVLLDTIATLVDHPGIGLEHMVLRSPSRVARGSGVSS